MHAAEEQPRTFSSLPAELLTPTATNFDACNLGARFAAPAVMCTVCLESAQAELHAALGEAVKHCLAPGAGPSRPKMIDCPYPSARRPDQHEGWGLPWTVDFANQRKPALAPATLTSTGDHTLVRPDTRGGKKYLKNRFSPRNSLAKFLPNTHTVPQSRTVTPSTHGMCVTCVDGGAPRVLMYTASKRHSVAFYAAGTG